MTAVVGRPQAVCKDLQRFAEIKLQVGDEEFGKAELGLRLRALIFSDSLVGNNSPSDWRKSI